MKNSTLSTALALALLTAVAQADVNSSVRTSALTYSDGNWHTLRTLVINTPVTRELVISYFAECAVESNDTTTWFQFQILVDGAAVPPTNSDQALCTGVPPDLNRGALHQWASNGTTVARRVSAGNHTVTVRGRLRGYAAGERVRIDDQSLVVLEDD